MKTELKTDVFAEPITLAEAKGQCRIDDADSDDMLRIYIAAAREYVENWSGTALAQSTYIFYFNEWQAEYKIYWPINSITSIEYKNADNVGTYGGTLTDYYHNAEQGLITLDDGAMSDLYAQSNAVKITASVGRDNIGKISAEKKLAMLLMVGHWYENREDSVGGTIITQIPRGANDLLASCRDHRL